jgi:hypothetical protein
LTQELRVETNLQLRKPRVAVRAVLHIERHDVHVGRGRRRDALQCTDDKTGHIGRKVRVTAGEDAEGRELLTLRLILN